MFYAIQQAFFKYDILLRGAIVVGDLYHKDNVVFGPALVDAYLLESTCAIFPRCILTEETLQECLHTCYSDLGRSIYKENFLKDNDGFYYFDYMQTLLSFERPSLESRQIDLIKDFINRNLAAPHPPKVRAKYEWLRSYYNRSIILYYENKSVDYLPFLID